MSGPTFDPVAVRALAQILADTGLTEIEIEQKDAKIRVVRALAPVQVTAAAPVAAALPAATAAAPATPAAPTATMETPSAPAAGAVTSPMVGVAYLTSEPGAPPFVTLGAKVTQGQTVLLIEAMKTFNQIKAPRAGTVTRILVESGSPVEFGEPLMVIE